MYQQEQQSQMYCPQILHESPPPYQSQNSQHYSSVSRLIVEEGSHVWPPSYQQLKDANVRRWPALYATQPINKVDKKSYLITGFTWAFKMWILESFRAATNDCYTRYRRLPRIVYWSLKNKFYRNMLKPFLHGQLPVQRLVPDEIEARSRWWVSSRAYFDRRNIEDERIPRHLNRNNYFEVPPEMYREFKEQRRGYKKMMGKSDDMSERRSWPEGWLSGDFLIRERAKNGNWTLSKFDTICLHPENNRFMILTDPHIIETLDCSMRPYPSWKDVNLVYMPINAGGVHWVTGAINLADFIFYVFYSMESESRMSMLEQQVRDWTHVINRILQMCGYFNGTGRQSYNFQFSYNDCFGYAVPQQQNAKDCGVITSKDELLKAYEQCRDISMDKRAMIENFLKIESKLDYEMQGALFRKAAKLEKQIRDKLGWLQQL
uniref:Phospholipase-like protein n=1 Tax=Tanacetum cinerariifolium TaxID=118510 RepID=A0A6L2NXW2_TANCI|nr:phospholipase-like protein [Tanacetum cinerariifolium]